MAAFPLFFLTATAAVLLCGSLIDAQDAFRNFQVASRNSTHITFSWDIVDGYYSSSYISYFRIYYRERPNTGSRSYPGIISYSDSSLKKIGPSFQYTSIVTTLSSYGHQFVMWVYVYRPSLNPSTAYSDQIYVEMGRQIYIEVNIKLWPSQTCLEFTAQSTGINGAVQNEMYWGIRKYCQCNYNYFQYIRIDNGYFTCAAGGYITFRANLVSTSVTADPVDLKNTLTTWLHGQDTDKTITIYGMQYFVEPGPCGVTVPNLNAPQCSTPDTTDTPTVAAVSSTVTTSTSTQDNTAVIIASVFAGMFFILSLGLIGYILAARRNHKKAKSAEVETTHDLKPASECCSRRIPLPHDNHPVYTSSDIPIQRNPGYAYGMAK